MLESSSDKILAILKPGESVLDVGGWACPFNRANYVLDAEPYETRGIYASLGWKPYIGPKEESFSKSTWIQRDICSKEPWPFADKQFDWCICSHTLEDIRDPLWVCSEISRVAKRGYIETPSRLWETCRGLESDDVAGLAHHRWLIENTGPNRIRFWMKYHSMHSHWRFSFPPSFLPRLTEEEKMMVCWWEGKVEAEEMTIHDHGERARFLADFVASRHQYPKAAYLLDSICQAGFRIRRRIRNRYWKIRYPENP
jgi:hypothetical protein